MSPRVILDDIAVSSDIPGHFVNATETRNRVDASEMMRTVNLLTGAAEAHRRMRFHVDMEFVDAGTSWTTAMSKLFRSLDEMVQGHINDSTHLFNVLNSVYSNHVDYLVTAVSNDLQECDTLAATVHSKAIKAQKEVLTTLEVNRAKLLRDKLIYLLQSMTEFNKNLEAEARKSTYRGHYFPNPLSIEDCARKFVDLKESLERRRIHSLNILIRKSSNGTLLSEDDADNFENTTRFRNDLSLMSWCLLSYKQALTTFRNAFVATKQSADFGYEIPSSTLLKFNEDNEWLESISSRYIASSLSKFELAKALGVNGSEIMTNANRLYTHIDTSLFSEANVLVNSWEKSMSSFYMNLVKHVNLIQRYMFPNDTALEQYLRRLSIWRIPIVNFQKSQVPLLFVVSFGRAACATLLFG